MCIYICVYVYIFVSLLFSSRRQKTANLDLDGANGLPQESGSERSGSEVLELHECLALPFGEQKPL